MVITALLQSLSWPHFIDYSQPPLPRSTNMDELFL